MRIFAGLLVSLTMSQVALADRSFEVEGRKETVSANGGIEYHRIVTNDDQKFLLEKVSGEQFADCEQGRYELVAASKLTSPLSKTKRFILLHAECYQQ